mmetsp:Transcript_27834/g.65430  ORF Transcript_27834/g.65430 Transcript_27834/m.65430 type:complete len:174 (-) Transcript_27834:1876-2397(-)
MRLNKISSIISLGAAFVVLLVLIIHVCPKFDAAMVRYSKRRLKSRDALRTSSGISVETIASSRSRGWKVERVLYGVLLANFFVDLLDGLGLQHDQRPATDIRVGARGRGTEFETQVLSSLLLVSLHQVLKMPQGSHLRPVAGREVHVAVVVVARVLGMRQDVDEEDDLVVLPL